MSIWIVKAVVQKSISFLPFKHKINYLFQKYITKGVNLTDHYFYDRLGRAKNHIDGYFRFSPSGISPDRCLEIGTGWYPTVPISFFLIGANKIYSVDVAMLTTKERVKIAIEKFLQAKERNLLQNYIKVSPGRMEELESLYKSYTDYTLEEILEKLNIVYLVENASKLSLPDRHIDLISSNNTFEHIYPDILQPILVEFKRILKTNGIMSHFIDLCDHFSYLDKSITIYNFLKFSDSSWSIIDNSIQPQNRMRNGEYIQMYKNVGLQITEEVLNYGNIELLKGLNLADKYMKMDIEDVAICECHFYSVKGD